MVVANSTGMHPFEQSLTGGGPQLATLSVSGNNDVMGKVLHEKESYIGNLENEIDEMRKEIEIQRE